MYKVTDMKCPECKALVWIFKLSDSTYRIECSRLSCEYVDEFDYVAPTRRVVQTRHLTPRRFRANVGGAGSASHLP